MQELEQAQHGGEARIESSAIAKAQAVWHTEASHKRQPVARMCDASQSLAVCPGSPARPPVAVVGHYVVKEPPAGRRAQGAPVAVGVAADEVLDQRSVLPAGKAGEVRGAGGIGARFRRFLRRDHREQHGPWSFTLLPSHPTPSYAIPLRIPCPGPLPTA